MGGDMDFLNRYSAQLLALLRIVSGLVFFSIGIAKLLHFPPVPMFAGVHPLDWPEGIAGIIETVGGALIVLGFFSRIAAFICSGEMAAAYFMVHAAMSPYPVLNNGTAAILYCFVFLYLAAAGPGPWSLNNK
jgi:putative oxidoreductase